MKFVRLLLITLAIIGVICALTAGLLLTPSVQRWALKRAVADQPGLKLDADQVAIGISTIDLRGLRLEQDGVIVTLESMQADYRPMSFLLKRQLVLGKVDVRGLMIDATAAASVKSNPAVATLPASAPGLLAQLQLPFGLVLDDIQVIGAAVFSIAKDQPPLRAEYTLTGGQFAPGQEGVLVLKAVVNNPVRDAGLGALQVQLTLRATQSETHDFNHVDATAMLDAQGKLLAEAPQLQITARLEKAAAQEKYTLSADTFARGVAENILSLSATWAAGQNGYTGQWDLKARTAQIEPFVLGAPLPDFSALGQGDFSLIPSTGAAAMRGKLNVEASRLEAVYPALTTIGAVKFSGEFDLAEADGVVQLKQLSLQLESAKPVLTVQLVRPAEYIIAEQRLHVGEAGAGDILNLQLRGLPLEWIRPFVAPLEISGEPLTGAFAVVAEKNRVLLRTTEPLLIPRLAVRQAGASLLSQADVRVSGQATLDKNELSAEISELLLTSPGGDRLNSRLTISTSLLPDAPVALAVSYDANLPTLLGPWLPMNPLATTGEANVILKGDVIEIRSFTTEVTDESDAFLLKATALRAFTFDLAQRRALAEVTGPTDLIRISTGRLALERFIPEQPEMAVTGSLQPGEFLLTVDGEKLSLRALAPLTLAGFSLVQAGQPTLTKLTIKSQPRYEFKGAGAGMVETGDVTLQSADSASILTASGTINHSDAAGVEGALTFSMDVPALASQPVFSKTRAVSQGRASGEIRASLGASKQVEGRMTVNGLVARDSGQTLPIANLSFRGIAQGDGRISLEVPLLLDRAGQRSDLKMTLDLRPQENAFHLDGKLTGEHVELPDALAVLSVFFASGIAPESTGASSTPRTAAPAPAQMIADTVPAWSKVRGSVRLDVKSATSRGEWAMTDLSGSVLVEPQELKLEKFTAAFSETSRLSASASLKFTKQRLPYALTGNFSLTEFDTGKFFKAVDPEKLPTIEGLFTVAGQVAGNGGTLEDTFSRTRGRFDLTSRQGIFRGLQRVSNKVSMASKALEIGASVLGSIFGSEKVTKATEKVAGQAYFVEQLAQSIGEFNYDQLTVRLVRDDTLNLTLEDLSIISPEVRLIGQGTVKYVEGKRVLDQPLHAALTFACRGKVEQLMSKARLLEVQRDELGFSRAKETVEIGGTLVKPDPTSFFTKLAAAKINDLLSPEN